MSGRRGIDALPDATAVERLRILQTAKSVALVGVSPNPIRSSNFVASYLVRTPYRTYMVNPATDSVLSHRSYPSLAELPEVPDIVDVFRRHDAIPGVVDEAIAVG
ncbi:MAG TPA: CoA-binding protein, partial [Acidimicrobiales bacterium]|nr:CoA-binding protein [Acidimicrobiales bacterium]